jgi:hypothetical protein
MENIMKQAKFLTVVYLLLGAVGHSAVSLADHSLAAADNAFGFRLIQQLAKD